MKRVLAMIVGAGLLLASQVCAVEKKEVAKDNELKTVREKLSYSIGLQLGTSLKEIKKDIDFSVAIQGMEDSFNDKKLLLTQEEIMKELMTFSKKMQEKQMKIREEQMKKMEALGKENKKQGEAFLAENKKKKNVVTTKSGLQYIVLSKGKGQKPNATDQVKVHYKGTLIDGTEFDSSYKREESVTFPVNRVIPGWTEALQLMNVGSKYQLFIPSDIAYGERATGPQIGPNATLIFEVELLSIEKIQGQQSLDEEMARRKRKPDAELAHRQGKHTQQGGSQQTIVVKQDPHHGKEWQTGMDAFGQAMRPHSKLNTVETEKRIRALGGLGTLIDLMNR